MAVSVIIDLESKVIRHLSDNRNTALTLSEISTGVGKKDEIETIFKICERLAVNPDRGIVKKAAATPFAAAYKKT